MKKIEQERIIYWKCRWCGKEKVSFEPLCSADCAEKYIEWLVHKEK